MKLVDSNLILRFLLKDHPKQSPQARKLFKNPHETLILTDIVVAEVIWILTSYYKFSKEDVAEKIYQLLKIPTLKTNMHTIVRTLHLYRNFNIDYIDAYLAAYCEKEKLEGIYSFDKDFDKINIIKLFEP